MLLLWSILNQMLMVSLKIFHVHSALRRVLLHECLQKSEVVFGNNELA